MPYYMITTPDVTRREYRSTRKKIMRKGVTPEFMTVDYEMMKSFHSSIFTKMLDLLSLATELHDPKSPVDKVSEFMMEETAKSIASNFQAAFGCELRHICGGVVKGSDADMLSHSCEMLSWVITLMNPEWSAELSDFTIIQANGS